MAVKTVPNKCIWCLQDQTSTTFNSESHVLPKCIGNIAQQVLPPGIVCDGCNQFFGHDLEPSLINEPIINTLAGILQLRDKDARFAYEHSPSGTHRKVHMNIQVTPNRITLTTHYEIKDQPNKPNETRTIIKSKDYDQRALAFLSRAVHKIAFETLAHNLYVGTGLKLQNKKLRDIDIFDPKFDVIRDWVRDGKPQNIVRPTIRNQRFSEVKTPKQLSEWGGWNYYFKQGIYCALNLFNDWYFVNLTSSPDKVKNDLLRRIPKHWFLNPVWMVGDKLQRIDHFKTD